MSQVIVYRLVGQSGLYLIGFIGFDVTDSDGIKPKIILLESISVGGKVVV